MMNNSYYYMAVAVNDPKSEELQFDWFIRGRIFLIFLVQVGKFKKASLMGNKN